ncbi:hypothetical protein N0V86_000586 [Didymella sp. IMI 355093]|nr:hypothetical protein N0V86_000586 [Didymella sp. IMI 355093]
MYNHIRQALTAPRPGVPWVDKNVVEIKPVDTQGIERLATGMEQVEIDDERAGAIEREEELEALRLLSAFDAVETEHTRGNVVFANGGEVYFEPGVEQLDLQDSISDDDEDEDTDM